MQWYTFLISFNVLRALHLHLLNKLLKASKIFKLRLMSVNSVIISKLMFRVCLIKTMCESNDQNWSSGTQAWSPRSGQSHSIHVFFWGHELSLVPVFSVLTFMIMPWGPLSIDQGTLSLRGIQMIFSPAEARNKKQVFSELCIPAEITLLFSFPLHLLPALFLLHYA